MNIIEENGLRYELDSMNFTANIIRSDKVSGDIIIPSYITYKSHKYIIKVIKEGSFSSNRYIQSIEFYNDSELQTIEKGSFSTSSLEKLMIPSSVTKLEDGWCQCTRELTEITISPLNRIYSYIGNKIIVGKSNEFNDIFNNLIFARRDIQKVKIPSYVKKISPFAFSECYELKSVILNENLISIGSEAFSFTSLHNFSIPMNLRELNDGWCRGISELNEITVSTENDHFKYIENKMIVGKSDEKRDIFDVLYFVRRDIEKLNVPSNIKYIKPYSFSECFKINNVTFCEDSELISIGKCSFMSSSISSLNIPEKVELLEDGWCRNTIELNSIVVSEKNKNFQYKNDSYIVEKKNDFDVIHFVKRNLYGDFSISKFVKQIASFAFNACHNLQCIEIEKNSYLSFIGDYSFASSSIKSIEIPAKVSHIGKLCFYCCSNLKKVLFDSESELNEIKQASFAFSSIQFISIPRSVNHLCERSFFNCEHLFGIELLGNDIEIDYYSFNRCKSLLLISFPNAQKIKIYNEFFEIQSNCVIFTNNYSLIEQFPIIK